MITGAMLALLAEDASTCGQRHMVFVVLNCNSFFRPAQRSGRVFLAAPRPLRRHGTTQARHEARREARASATRMHAKQMSGRQRMRDCRIGRSGEWGAGTEEQGTQTPTTRGTVVTMLYIPSRIISLNTEAPPDSMIDLSFASSSGL
jgi:hypothetical protein